MRIVHYIADHPIYSDHYNFTATRGRTYKDRGPRPLKYWLNVILPDYPRQLISRKNTLRNIAVLIMGYYDHESNLVVSGNGYLELNRRKHRAARFACK